ncbi:MAG: trypsin-like peptidase domain-containing protein, partial [Planctomycetota bacterium]|nr:trypsin-like peptidase domain-containing protein [Planctomycetota bacterium]
MRYILLLTLLLLSPRVGITQDQDSTDLPTALESSHVSLGKKVGPAVVSIECVRKEGTKEKKRRTGFNLSMMDGGVFKYRPTNTPVSGTIIDANGLILTTYFNIRDKVESINVKLQDGRTYPATIKGFNATYDLALLKIEAKELPTLPNALLGRISTGQIVMACGRAPDRSNLTLNPGIVSAPWRMSGRGIQIDSLMNYGNVGGPVVTRSGKMIGISCRVDTKYSGSTGQNSGIGFVVTWDKIDSVLPGLKTGKNVKEVRRPF